MRSAYFKAESSSSPAQTKLMPSGYKKILTVVFGMFLDSCLVAYAETPSRSNDAIADAQTPRADRSDRPEQKKTDHDQSDLFNAQKASPLSPTLKGQPKEGKVSGFDFFRDGLNSDQPFQKFEDSMKKEIAGKADVMDAQKKLLGQRYNLTVKNRPRSQNVSGKTFGSRSHGSTVRRDDVG